MHLSQVTALHGARLLAALGIFILIKVATVQYTDGDSRYSLLVSQSILQNGTIRLERYDNDVDLVRLNGGRGWMLNRWAEEGYTYHFYPIGTPVLALPFVAVANLFGMDMVFQDHDRSLQLTIAGLIAIAVFFLLYRLARVVTTEWPAFVFAISMVLGTSIMSSLGAALWSHDFETLFILMVLLEFFEVAKGKRDQVRPWYVGLLLFGAYLCRPTAAIFVVMSMVYIGWKHRKQLPLTLIWSGVPFGLFILWSFLQYGRPLPVYYDPSTWGGNPNFWNDILPILVGPARGLWIFTPVFLLAFAGWAIRPLRRNPLWILVWIWMGLHILMAARSGSPWGGWSFGPRLLLELAVGYALLMVMILDHLERFPAWMARWLPIAFVVLSGFGLYAHTYKGQFFAATYHWNGMPNIDAHWHAQRWNWRYPQILATEKANARQLRDHHLYKQIQQYALRLPKDAVLLAGQPDAEDRSSFAAWNRTDRLKGMRVYSTLAALKREGVTDFWTVRNRLPEVLQAGHYNIDTTYATQTLAQFMKTYAQYKVVIVNQDESSFMISPETRRYFKDRGSRLDSLKFRESYLAVFDHDSLVHEELGPRPLAYTVPLPPQPRKNPVKLKAGGFEHGNTSSVSVSDVEHSRNGRGMNVVVLSDRHEVIWSTNFDMHTRDEEQRFLFHVTAKDKQ